jgi:hypothetical protein
MSLNSSIIVDFDSKQKYESEISSSHLKSQAGLSPFSLKPMGNSPDHKANQSFTYKKPLQGLSTQQQSQSLRIS